MNRNQTSSDSLHPPVIAGVSRVGRVGGFLTTMKSRKKFPVHRYDEMTKLFRSGMTIRDIAQVFECQHTTIRLHLRKMKIVLTDDEVNARYSARKSKHTKWAVAMGAKNRSSLRNSAESCVICLSSIGLGRRVIARMMGIPDAMASNSMKKIGVDNHPRTFRKLKSANATSERRRTNQRIARAMRTRVRDSFRLKGLKKKDSARELIGCTLDEFRRHLESKMTKRMTWANYGTTWHIDHVIPCAKFDLANPEEVMRCFNWTNMRPLCARRNIREHARRGLHQQQVLPI